MFLSLHSGNVFRNQLYRGDVRFIEDLPNYGRSTRIKIRFNESQYRQCGVTPYFPKTKN